MKVVNERKVIFMKRVFVDRPRNQSVRFSNKNEIDFCERKIQINSRSFPRLQSINFNQKQSDLYLSEKYKIGSKWDKQEDGRLSDDCQLKSLEIFVSVRRVASEGEGGG